MLLPTMSDEEKAYEAFRATNWLCDFMNKHHEDVVEKFKKGTKFPYFQRISITDDKNNEWICLFFILSKTQKKQKLFYTMAYTVYDVPRKHKEEDLNAGKGCLLFDPFAMRRTINNPADKFPGVIMDIVPHAFNRYTERYLKPLGKDNISFSYKVESMLKRWQWFDVLADIHGDKNAKKHADNCMCPYDVIMRGGGMLRGQMIHNLLIRFNTYVSEDMMFDNQLDRQEEMKTEYSWFRANEKIIIQNK